MLFPLPLGPLTYLEPLSGGRVELGQRVAVPWHGGVKVGVAVAERNVDPGRGLELKHVLGALDAVVWLRPWAARAIDSVARSSGVPAGLVLATLALPGLAPDLDHQVRLHQDAPELLGAEVASDPTLAGAAPTGGWARPGEWMPADDVPAAALDVLRKQGLVDERLAERARTKRVLVPLHAADQGLSGKRADNQRAALALLWEVGFADSAAALARDAGVGESTVRSLVTKGYAGYAEIEVAAPAIVVPHEGERELPRVPELTVPPEGDGAVVGGTRLERLAAIAPRLDEDLELGRSVIVIAPEVAMAAAAAGALADRLPIQYLTGGSDEDSRRRAWQEVGEVGPVVVVGTFAALLAPVSELGRVVLLDAGSESYKLLSGARTHVAKVAQQVAQAAGAALTRADVAVTPEILHAVPEASRRALPLPDLRLHVADMRESANWPLHPDLQQTLRQVAERGRQAVVIAPRRGFSGAFGCRACGWAAPCPNCDLTLRYHLDDARLRCHQCGHDEPLPDTCPDCGNDQLEALKGAGTEWVASQLARLLPGTLLVRYDRDRKDDIAPLIAGEPGVIIGTTAALRLPVLPALSLMAVTSFEAHLYQADYRAEEEALRALLQFAELAPAKRTLLVVQSHAPGHAVLEALAADDTQAAVAALVERQLERRRRFGYPPFTSLAKLQFTAKERSAALQAASKAADSLLLAGASADEVLGPEAAPVERVRGRYAYHLLLKAADDTRMEALLAALPQRFAGVTVRSDVDPRMLGELID